MFLIFNILIFFVFINPFVYINLINTYCIVIDFLQEFNIDTYLTATFMQNDKIMENRQKSAYVPAMPKRPFRRVT